MYNDDYYRILNVHFNATDEEIKASFQRLRQTHHPDYGGSQAYFEKISEAFNVLSNVNERQKYNEWYINKFINATRSNAAVYQVKILNLDDFKTRTVNSSIDIVRFPPETFCENGTYYAVEKDNSISICTKKQWDDILKQVVLAVANAKKKQSFNSNAMVRIIILFIIIVVAIISLGKCSNTRNNSEKISEDTTYSETDTLISDESKTSEIELPEIDYVESPLPENGTVSHNYDPYSNSTSVLGIKLPKSETDTYYYIKLVNSVSEDTVQSVFMYPGQDMQISVPCGNYKIKYACGQKWYGYENLFGPYGGYSKSDEIIEFTHEYGHSITLYPVVNGNFSTDSITLDEF